MYKRYGYDLIKVQDTKSTSPYIIHNQSDKVIVLSGNTNANDISNLIINYFT